MGARMNTAGILTNETDMQGYSCQMLGDLSCEHGEPACSGQIRHHGDRYIDISRVVVSW